MPTDHTQTLADLHDELSAKLAELTTGEDWLGFLRASRQFHTYSPGNQMLLVMQGAHGHVAGYRHWQRIPAVGGGTCQVAKGERGLMILAPITLTARDVDPDTGEEIVVGRRVARFKPIKVFHQGQLVAPPDLPEPPLPQLPTGDNATQHLWGAVTGYLESRGYQVSLVPRSPGVGWNGRTDFAALTVEVCDDLEPPAQLKTLFHEWAHIQLGHDTRPVSRDVREVEAESVAYLLCGTVGVDSSLYTVPYVAGWASGDIELINSTAQAVLGAANTMVEVMEQELSIDLTPTLTAPAPATVTELHPPQPTVTPSPWHPSMQPRLEPLPPTPLLDQAHGETRAVLAGLVDETGRAEFLAALDDLTNQLAVAVGMCRDAGFDLERTAVFLHAEQGADRDQLTSVLLADERANQAPDTPTGPREIAAAVRRAVEHAETVAGRSAPSQPLDRAGALARLGASDREVLALLDTSNPKHLIEAARLLRDAGLDRSAAGDVLAALHTPARAIDAALNQTIYNPTSGRTEPMWPAEQPEPAVPAGGRDEPPPVNLIEAARKVATHDDPQRLAQLGEAFGLTPQQAVQLWAAADIPHTLAAAAALSNRVGDTTQATVDLVEHWPQPLDWRAYVTTAAAGPSVTAVGQHQHPDLSPTMSSIFAEWDAMAAMTPAMPVPNATPVAPS